MGPRNHGHPAGHHRDGQGAVIGLSADFRRRRECRDRKGH